MAPFPLRPRTPDDRPAVADLLWATHRSDGYPIAPPPDMAAWGEAEAVLAAWVAIDPAADGHVVGHAVLTEPADDVATAQWVAASDRPARALAVVRRLVVHRSAQGTGTGAALLAAAVDHAHDLGRRPVLDMSDNLAAAGRLYERAGFERVGTYDLALTEHLPPGSDEAEPDGTRTHHLHVLTWIGPEPAS